jgi:hypothetical protein
MTKKAVIVSPKIGWKDLVQFGLMIVGALLVAGLLVNQWGQLRQHQWRFHVGWLGLSALCTLVAWFIEAQVWRQMLAMLGSEIPYRFCLRMWFSTMLTRYVPGNIWQPVSMSLYGQRHGITPETMFTSVVLFQMVTLLAALPISALYLAMFQITFLGQASVLSAWLAHNQTLLIVGCITLCLAPVLLFEFYPQRLFHLLNRLLSMLKRPPLVIKFSGRKLLLAIIPIVGSWLVWGVSFCALVLGVIGDPSLIQPVLLPYLVLVYPIAYAIGAASLITPSGLVVREGAFYVLLTPVLGADVAIVIALASRLWTTLLEVVMALGVYLVSMRERI